MVLLPINVLRGRESKSVREILFKKWKPLYILKPTINYGFSEWSEYRDILYIGKKETPTDNHKVKFCLVKKDLVKLKDADVTSIVKDVRRKQAFRSKELDIESFKLSEINQRFPNMMWFCGVSDLKSRDILINFVNTFLDKLSPIPRDEKYRKTGYRAEGGITKVLFLNYHSEDSRIEQAFLHFTKKSSTSITAQSPLGAIYNIERTSLSPSLRTPVGIRTMDITNSSDYVAHAPYKELNRVCSAAGINPPSDGFWADLKEDIDSIKSHVLVSRRLNPFSPSNYLVSFFSSDPISPSDQLNVILEDNLYHARALCGLFNSALFFAQLFLLKEESTGRYIDIRLYDLEEMNLIPSDVFMVPLTKVFNKYSKVEFPALRDQFDQEFEQRYEEFWENERGTGQRRLFSVLRNPVKPFPARLSYDLEICQALELPVTDADLVRLYEVFVKEMIIIRGLTRD